MTTTSILLDLTIIFVVAVAIVTVLHRIGAPTIAGFIFAGALIGPRSLGLISHTHHVEVLAEVGVILLMFEIGIELSLARIRRLWKPVLLGGTLQIVLTTTGVALIGIQFGFPLSAAVFFGFLIAVSSTAIVLRSLEHHGETDSLHGRLTLGILIFQDLCVIPMIMAIPLLAGSSGSNLSIAWTTAKAVLVLLLVVVSSRVVIPRVLRFVAGSRQRELFVLTVFLVCIGTAWLVSLVGISLALGAFLAGLVVSDSEYGHQALSEMIPLKEVLTSLFFISVGMLLDPGVLIQHLDQIGLLLLAVLGGKFLVVVLTGIILRLPLRFSILAGVSLAQVGEFFFVLLHAANGTSLLDPTVSAKLSAVAILSMFITPILIKFGPHVAAGATRILTLTRLMGIRSVAEIPGTTQPLQSHVIIAGWGITGRELASILKERQIPYVIADLNPDNVREALLRKEPVYFGDVTSADVLRHLGLATASELIVAVNDHKAGMWAVTAARKLGPDLHIIVRTRFVAEVPDLLAAGADQVIPAEMEAAVQLISRILKRRGVSDADILELAGRVRNAEHSSKEPCALGDDPLKNSEE